MCRYDVAKDIANTSAAAANNIPNGCTPIHINLVVILSDASFFIDIFFLFMFNVWLLKVRAIAMDVRSLKVNIVARVFSAYITKMLCLNYLLMHAFYKTRLIFEILASSCSWSWLFTERCLGLIFCYDSISSFWAWFCACSHGGIWISHLSL